MEAAQKSNPTKASRSSRGRWLRTAAKVFVFGSLGVLFYCAHEALVPIAMALLLALILSGPVESLHKRGVSRSLSAVVILALALLLIGIAVSLLWTPAQDWFSHAPQTLMTVKQKLGPLSQLVNRLEGYWKNASSMGSAPQNEPTKVVSGESTPLLFLNAGGSAIASSLTFVIVTLFLLTGGPPMLARMAAAFASDLRVSSVLQILEKVRAEVGQFYLTTTSINMGLGTATTLCMWAWGMPTPYLWGALAAIANYIPYAGSATTLVVITLVAFVSFDTLAHVAGVAATYVVLATIEGQVAQPVLVGRRMEVNPLLIFLGLWFGGVFWGIPGIILATPALVALKVIAENSASGKPLVEFLGPNDQTPQRDDRLRKLSQWLTHR